MGAGRTEMARALFGADPKQSGSIYIGGEKWRLNLRRMPSDMESVIFSEDRKRHGVVVGRSVAEKYNDGMSLKTT